MKKIGIVLGLVAFSTSAAAFAGNTGCVAEKKLSCRSVYNKGHQEVAGPSGDATVEDIQPEPFDPSDCEASVVLYTDAGKFVATYIENSGTVTAWIDTKEKEISLLQDVPLTSSKSVETRSGTVTFDCSLN